MMLLNLSLAAESVTLLPAHPGNSVKKDEDNLNVTMTAINALLVRK
jgi:hypothetical protein